MGAESLTVKDVTDGDEGTYTCIMNTTLDQDSASAMLTVVGMFTVEHSFKSLLRRSGNVSGEIMHRHLDACIFKERKTF